MNDHQEVSTDNHRSLKTTPGRKIPCDKQQKKQMLIKLFKQSIPPDCIEDITAWREDMNFIFEWQEQYISLAQGLTICIFKLMWNIISIIIDMLLVAFLRRFSEDF